MTPAKRAPKNQILFSIPKKIKKYFQPQFQSRTLKLLKNTNFSICYYPDRDVLRTYERRGTVIKLIVLKLI